jgi:spore coat protein U-like protein
LKTKSLKLIALTLALILALPAGTAFAGTQSSTLSVTATVNANCTIAVGSLAFTPAYDPIVANATAAQPLNGVGSLSVTCTNASNPAITMGQGANPAGGSTNAAPLRQMSNGGSGLLSYNLYSDAAMTLPWDNVTGATITGTGVAQSVPVYGQIPGGQNAQVGAYLDTVITTITF